MLKRLAIAIAVISAMSLASTTMAAEGPVLLKVPIAFATKLPGLGSTVKWIGDRIGTLSDGSVKMKVYEPNKLVAPFEILDAVSKGSVNAGYTTAGYWFGKMKASALFAAVPFGPEAPEYLAWMWYGNGMKLYQEMYDENGYNVKVHLCGVIAPETSGWFNEPITNAGQLKGMKMRFFGLGGQVMQSLGVTTSLLPGGEIFPALEKGAIDATEFSMPAIDSLLGFHKLVKYNYFPGWHQQATTFELMINKDVWNGMSEHQQMVVDMACRAAVADSLAYTEAIQFTQMTENVETNGVKQMYWSEEMLTVFQEAWEAIVEENRTSDPGFKKVWDDLAAFRAGYDLWESHAFLPRAKR